MRERQILANLSSKGLNNFLITHKNFVKETISGVEMTGINGEKTIVKTLDDITCY